MEQFVPRKQFDPHCDFSSTYYLDEGGRLVAMSRYDQNDEDTERTDFVQKTNKYTGEALEGPGGACRGHAAHALCGADADAQLLHLGHGLPGRVEHRPGPLHGCCVHIITGKGEIIPFCAFHLTGADGRRLYTN